MSIISFQVTIDEDQYTIGRVKVPDGTERSSSMVARAMHDVAERLYVWAEFQKIVGPEEFTESD